MVDGIATEHTTYTAEDGFVHTFKVVAKEKNGSGQSWSNSITLRFSHDLVLPNVITPNGDGLNDYFVIPKLDLYPGNELRVFNRYGTQVYAALGYKNDWDAKQLPPGVYYYYFQTNKKNIVLKGWVDVMK